MYLRSIYSEYRLLNDWLARKWARFHYQYVDIYLQSQKLKIHRPAILKSEICSPLDTNLYCIFIYYEPDGEISMSVQAVLNALVRQGVNVILVSNVPLSQKQRDFFEPRVHSYLIRNNQGFDFGGYQDAILLMNEANIQVEKLILLNDSVYFLSRGLDEMIKALLEPFDAIGAFENWGEEYHLQSFCLSISARVFEAKGFVEFWRNYKPVSNRLYAIESGEKALSRVILRHAKTSHVIYSASRLRDELARDENYDVFDNLRVICNPWRNELERMDQGQRKAFLSDKVTEFVNVTSPIHSGAYFFPKYLHSPMFKKDVVYRGRFSFWEVENWIGEIATQDEKTEILTMLRRKGDFAALSKKDRRKYQIGVK